MNNVYKCSLRNPVKLKKKDRNTKDYTNPFILFELGKPKEIPTFHDLNKYQKKHKAILAVLKYKEMFEGLEECVYMTKFVRYILDEIPQYRDMDIIRKHLSPIMKYFKTDDFLKPNITLSMRQYRKIMDAFHNATGQYKEINYIIQYLLKWFYTVYGDYELYLNNPPLPFIVKRTHNTRKKNLFEKRFRKYYKNIMGSWVDDLDNSDTKKKTEEKDIKDFRPIKIKTKKKRGRPPSSVKSIRWNWKNK